ncbi:class I SAM-dependent methyltransferase [Kitasatospora cinereorecta]|uniref:Class I SAM-dependent methyltransferase n=1 Tax=Kitasatospora cinereorecta TaxID=285560 RepID=A0ABW0V9Z8_9ACTN
MGGDFDRHERRMWAGSAEAYAGTFGLLCAGAVPELVAAAAVRPGARVLDVGTGPGTVAAEAGRRGARVTAVDAEPGMLELAAANAPEAELYCAALPALPFADGAFDAALGNFVVNHVEEPVAALAELRRVVRPGGRTAVTIWDTAVGAQAMGLFSRAMDEAAIERPAFPRLPVDYERTTEGLAGLLDEAGWSEVECRKVTWTHLVDPQEWWRGPAEGVANLGLVVRGLEPEAYLGMKAAYDRLAAAEAGPDGLLRVPAVALLATAVR